MAELVIKLPDVGEGVAEAELAELPVKVGDVVREGETLAAVLTDKATVEIPSPAPGKVTWIGFEIGTVVAVGSPLVKLEVAGAAVAASLPAKAAAPSPVATKPKEQAPAPATAPAAPVAPRAQTQRPLASPAVRSYAREKSVELQLVRGTGPGGRVLREDVDGFAAGGQRQPSTLTAPDDGVERIKIVGIRRVIAQRLQDTMRRIPHFSYIEEVDVTELETLRADINQSKAETQPRLTLLPFLMRALVLAVRRFPEMNARFDDEAETVLRFRGVHLGIATQTANGLLVPVVRHVETLDVWRCAEEITRLAAAARAGTASREELSGSTLSITSLGSLGGLATTPVINSPEVAIVGVNKISIRPVWRGAGFEPRKIMNLSSSFDHRIIDGWNAAEFIQYLRALLESPARIFIDP